MGNCFKYIHENGKKIPPFRFIELENGSKVLQVAMEKETPNYNDDLNIHLAYLWSFDWVTVPFIKEFGGE